MSNDDASSTLPPLPSQVPDSLSRAEWLLLLRADQQRRWRSGERVLVEEYLTRWPTLAEDAEGLLDLIYSEVLLREEGGERVTLDEYVRRFPKHQASLKRQFDLHRALAAGSLLEAATSGNGTSPPTRPPSIVTRPPATPDRADTSNTSATGEGTPDESSAPPTVGEVGPDPAAPEPRSEELRAGRYLLFDEIGRGGMGAVLRGRDPGLGREVALKVLLEKHGHEPGVARRFVEEAQIAGQLQHPSVVPVYELGNFEDGRPYFAMKLVKGRTLAALLKERADPSQDRPRFLKIFEQVCQAVAYAHSKGVIHRDLKPANVMVGAFGEVQVMDWGLAKVLGGPSETQPDEGPGGTVVRTVRSGSSAVESRPGSVMGTPAYMPPEQALGETDRLDRRCDVFGLGAVLCEVLTGRPPYDAPDGHSALRKAMRADLADAFARLAGCGADGELVALAKRCLAAEPAERPADAGEVATATSAYLASVEERLRQAEVDRAAAQARAEEEAQTRRVAEEKASVERRARRLTAGLAAALLLLGTAGGGGAWWVQQQRAERKAAVETDLEKAHVLQRQGRWAEARAVLEGTRERLRATGPEHLSQRIADVLANGDLVDRLEAIRLKRSTIVEGKFDDRGADRDYAALFRETGLGTEGEEPGTVAARMRASPLRDYLVTAVDDWALVAREDPKRQDWLLEVARLADPDSWRDRFRDPKAWRNRDRLEDLAQGLLDDGKELAKQKPPLLAALGLALEESKADAVPLLAAAQARYPDDFWLNFDLGNALYGTKKWAEAIGFYRAAVAVRPSAAAPHNNLGTVLLDQKQYAAAAAEYRKAIEFDPKLATAHNNLSTVLREQKQYETAVAEARRAIDLDPKDAAPHHNLGNVLSEQKQYAAAAAEFRKAIELDPKAAMPHNGLGNILANQKQYEAAAVEYHKAIDLDPKYATPHHGLGLVLESQKQYAAAAAEYRKAIDLDPKFARPHYNLGNVLQEQKQYAAATVEYRRAIDLDPKDALPHNGLGNVLSEQKQYAAAAAEFRKAIELDPNYPFIGLGNVLLEQKQYAAAAAEYRRAIDLDPKDALPHGALGLALLRIGRFTEARDATRRCRDLLQPSDPLRQRASEQLRQCEQLLALDQKLAAILEGTEVRASDNELLALADLCQQPFRRRYSASAHFYAEAFNRDAKLARDLQQQFRYNAACAAALASNGKGDDAPLLPDKVAFRLRRQALDWLKDDLAAYAKLAERDQPTVKQTVRQRLEHWQQDADLASVRDPEALARLPEAERRAWRQLWADVATTKVATTKGTKEEKK